MKKTVDHEEIFTGLYEEFENYAPNDEDYLEEYPELEEEINAINALSPNSEAEYTKAIQILYDFLNAWYPDSIEAEDKEKLNNKLAIAKAYLYPQV